MSNLTIRTRIILFVGIVGVAFSTFMSLFFPVQALNMGNRLLSDSAVTLSTVFGGAIEPAFGTLGFGGEQILTDAIKQLTTTSDEAADPAAAKTAPAGDAAQAAPADAQPASPAAPEASGAEAEAEPTMQAEPVEVLRVTVWDATGVRLDGYNDEAAKSGNATPVDKLIIDSSRPAVLSVTAPVKSGKELKGFFTIEVSKTSFNALVARNRWMTILASFVALGCMLAAGALMARSITAGIRTAVEAIDRVAEGDLTVSIDVRSKDEVGQMGRALARSLDAMRASLGQVRSLANDVAAAAQLLSSSTEEISAGTQQQAASTEETASSLEEMTSTIKQNADNADQAKEASESARTVAAEGGRVVQEAVEAVGEINVASRRIADIIGSVDEIAFQTNLLALNAAVEAARAGEQGRGFAVVAAEVRSLAQRSATAAKEIKGLIKDSMQKVERGSALVNESGRRLDAIVNAVARTTSITAEIAAASREQASGVEQLNRALAQIDQVTQENAGQTGELSGTAQTLAHQAEQLQDLVARFKLDDGAVEEKRPAASAPKPPPAPAARPAAPKAPAPPSQPVRATPAHSVDVVAALGPGTFEEI